MKKFVAICSIDITKGIKSAAEVRDGVNSSLRAMGVQDVIGGITAEMPPFVIKVDHDLDPGKIETLKETFLQVLQEKFPDVDVQLKSFREITE